MSMSANKYFLGTRIPVGNLDVLFFQSTSELPPYLTVWSTLWCRHSYMYLRVP